MPPTAAEIETEHDVGTPVKSEGLELEIDADPDIGNAPLTVQFSAVLDADLPGPVLFQWDFGDGSREENNPTTHTYELPGEYTATLTVTDGRGRTATRDVQIQVDARES